MDPNTALEQMITHEWKWHLRAENGLTMVSKFTKELHNSPGRLRIETRRRLIQEE